jgi:hypothetical protein
MTAHVTEITRDIRRIGIPQIIGARGIVDITLRTAVDGNLGELATIEFKRLDGEIELQEIVLSSAVGCAENQQIAAIDKRDIESSAMLVNILNAKRLAIEQQFDLSGIGENLKRLSANTGALAILTASTDFPALRRYRDERDLGHQ